METLYMYMVEMCVGWPVYIVAECYIVDLAEPIRERPYQRRFEINKTCFCPWFGLAKHEGQSILFRM